MFKKLRILVVTTLFIPALAVAGDIESKGPYAHIKGGSFDMTNHINQAVGVESVNPREAVRDIKGGPVDMMGYLNQAQAASGSTNKVLIAPLHVRFHPNRLFVPGDSHKNL
ncbi:hypothetical protein ACFVYJ_00065 [Pontibacter sp. JAM-7]|uniref:hypothetical protein n=1 Tax=Pontibacter sp. JAM-7 TaxID=3366581 RepID=UPI003AF805B2